MRKTLLVGLVLAVGAVLVVLVSAALDLELDSFVLLGVGAGAVIALVPDRTPFARLGGFVGGFLAAWAGYLVRGAVLPDSTGGRAVAAGLVVVLAVGVAAASLDRVPLWSTLLGAGVFAGAYEYTYVAAPPEVASTSLSTATALLLTVAVGFLATAVLAPAGEQQSARRTPAAGKRRDDAANARLDDLMMGEAR